MSENYKLIAKSKLFDPEWYLEKYKDVASAKKDPVEHYLQFGWKEGRLPSEQFDGDAYLEANPDVEEAGFNPLVHYLRFGEKEQRTLGLYNRLQKDSNYKLILKSKLFDANWYLEQNPDVKASGIDPIEHYLKHGWKEGRQPSEQFDLSLYLKRNPDVAMINPLLHFLEHANKEDCVVVKGCLSPIRIGPRLAFDHTGMSSGQIMGDSGWNVGNLAFCFAINRVLGGVRNVQWSEVNQIRPGEIGVFAGANQLGAHCDMKNMADRMGNLRTPQIAIGLGAQQDAKGAFGLQSYGIPRLLDGTLKWLEVLAEHAVSSNPNISVRGEFTYRVLEKYGFAKNAVVLGCPTLFISQDQNLGQTIWNNLKDVEKVVLATGTPRWKNMQQLESSLVHAMVSSGQGGFIVQHPQEMISLALGEWEALDVDMFNKLKHHYLPGSSDEEFKKWAMKFGHLFTNIPSWMDYYKQNDFVVGPRIHGIMLAIQAGVPALCIAIDSRTEELCQTMKIPYITPDKCANGLAPKDLRRIFEEKFDPDEFDRNRKMLATCFRQFLSNNRLNPINLI